MTAPTDPNLYIQTRPDGRRVFHLGSLGPLPQDGDAAKTHHLGAYSDGGVDVPNHWWNAQVTDRTNCPITIKRTPAQIVAANRMFFYGAAGYTVPAQPKRVPYTQMGPSNVARYMPTTGERPDIGLITDNSAYYMMGGDPLPMIDWAQAAGSCPMHFRDEATGKPVDLFKYPSANAYDQPNMQGSPWLPKGPKNAGGYSQFGGGWVPQQAHYCEMSYLAFQATLDIGFLEDLQFSANFTVLTDAGLSHKLGKPTVRGEYRGVAWSFRNLFMAHTATLDAEAAGTLPVSCHPSSYWKALLDNALAYYDPSRLDPTNQTFRLVVRGFPQFAIWQCNYMNTALAFGVLTGHAEWQPLYLWALGQAIDTMSGQSGYPPGYGIGYYFDTAQPDWKSAFLVGVPSISGAEPPDAATAAKLQADQFNGGVAMRGVEYLMTTRAVLVMAQHLDSQGICPVRKTYPNLDACVATADKMLHNSAKPLDPRTAVGLIAATPLPPIPIPIPPPPAQTPQQTLDILAADMHAALTKAGY